MNNDEIIENLKKTQNLLRAARTSGTHADADLTKAVSLADEYCSKACDPLKLNHEEVVKYWANKAYIDIQHRRYKKAKMKALSNVGVFLELMKEL